MNIALLNVKIMVQKNTVTVDKIGNHKNKWTDYYSCYATVSNESPSENTAAGTVVDILENDKVCHTSSKQYNILRLVLDAFGKINRA